MEAVSLIEKLDSAQKVLTSALEGRNPKLAIILGSGLGSLAETLENALCIPFEDIPYMKKSTATGHVGRFVCGLLNGVEVLAMQGRLHGYEGNSSEEVAFPVWLMNRIGVKALITTNAVGAINESYHVGDFCIMSDQINFTGRNPVVGTDPDKESFRFFSMLDAFEPSYREIAKQTARELDIPVQEGVYLGLLGPSFETPAEIRAFRTWGADTVAMSVCEEVIAARHVGMKVLGVSLCSNMACGVNNASPNDVEVFEVAKSRETDFCRLISEIVPKLKLDCE